MENNVNIDENDEIKQKTTDSVVVEISDEIDGKKVASIRLLMLSLSDVDVT